MTQGEFMQLMQSTLEKCVYEQLDNELIGSLRAELQRLIDTFATYQGRKQNDVIVKVERDRDVYRDTGLLVLFFTREGVQLANDVEVCKYLMGHLRHLEDTLPVAPRKEELTVLLRTVGEAKLKIKRYGEGKEYVFTTTVTMRQAELVELALKAVIEQLEPL